MYHLCPFATQSTTLSASVSPLLQHVRLHPVPTLPLCYTGPRRATTRTGGFWLRTRICRPAVRNEDGSPLCKHGHLRTKYTRAGSPAGRPKQGKCHTLGVHRPVILLAVSGGYTLRVAPDPQGPRATTPSVTNRNHRDTTGLQRFALGHAVALRPTPLAHTHDMQLADKRDPHSPTITTALAP